MYDNDEHDNEQNALNTNAICLGCFNKLSSFDTTIKAGSHIVCVNCVTWHVVTHNRMLQPFTVEYLEKLRKRDTVEYEKILNTTQYVKQQKRRSVLFNINYN